MKIATWNIERLKHKSELNKIINLIEEQDADILVLTETDSRIILPNFKYRIDTPKLKEIEPSNYLETENRVSIFTNYEIEQQFETFDKYTSLCIELKTEVGNLKVYGTIIGIYGNRNENFRLDLAKQIDDFERLSKDNNLCIVGDYNISFADNYFFTNWGRNELNKSFNRNNLDIISKQREKCIDHIAISKPLTVEKQICINEWNQDFKLSDHKGIMAHL
ncbi:MAG: endonuclease/exonuclease/phosphatase family protein [Candidatus Methylacidiphilales bacterium]